MSKEEAKQLFKNIYDEKPSDFKTDFDAVLNKRIFDKVEAKRTEIIDNINSPAQQNEEEAE